MSLICFCFGIEATVRVKYTAQYITVIVLLENITYNLHHGLAQPQNQYCRISYCRRHMT